MRLEIPGFSRYYLETEDNNVYTKNYRPLKPYVLYNRYEKHPVEKYTMVSDDGLEKHVFKHRIVYSAYHPDEDISDYQINHLDEDSMNNCIDNLELCTAKENMNWGTVGKRISEATKGRTNNHRSRPVIAYDLETSEKEYYPSIAEAVRIFGGDKNDIIRCCQGLRVSAYGRIWQYADGYTRTF